MKAILISGSYKNNEIKQNIIDFLNNNIANDKNIAFIASNFEDYECNEKFVNKLCLSFKDKRIDFDNIYIIDSRISRLDMIKYINDSNIIFLLGGDTLSQIKHIKEYDLVKYICNENKIIMGMSAGAINMAKKVVLAKDISDNIPELSIYEGLGITNINIEPHCDFLNKEHWEDLLEASKFSKLVAMHDDSYIIINNDEINYYGHYLILDNKKLYYRDNEITLEEFLKKINYE